MKAEKSKKADETLESLATAEVTIKYDEIILQRTIVIKEMEFDVKEAAKLGEISAIEEEGKEGWFGGWFSRKTEQDKAAEA